MFKSFYVVFTTISGYVVFTTIYAYVVFTTISSYVELTSVMFKSLESETPNPKPHIPYFLLHIFQTPYLILSFVVIFNECYG